MGLWWVVGPGFTKLLFQLERGRNGAVLTKLQAHLFHNYQEFWLPGRCYLGSHRQEGVSCLLQFWVCDPVDKSVNLVKDTFLLDSASFSAAAKQKSGGLSPSCYNFPATCDGILRCSSFIWLLKKRGICTCSGTVE